MRDHAVSGPVTRNNVIMRTAGPPGIDFVVRAGHDRFLAADEVHEAWVEAGVEAGTLFQAPEAWEVLGGMTVTVSPRRPGSPGGAEKGRIAKVLIKAGTITIKRPASGESSDPASLTLTLVEIRETEPPAAGVKKPLLWRLVTTLPVATLEEAIDVVHCYRLRWRIEEVFRALKSDGLQLEDSQVTEANGCSSSRRLAWWQRRGSCNWSTPATAASGPPPTSSTPKTSPPPPRSAPNWKATPPASATSTQKVRWRGWPGSWPASAAGTATTNHPAPRPWPAASTACSTASTASALLKAASPPNSETSNMYESRSPFRGGVGAGMSARIFTARRTQGSLRLSRHFVIHDGTQHGACGLVLLYGIESPGLTSSLAIGAHIAALEY